MTDKLQGVRDSAAGVALGYFAGLRVHGKEEADAVKKTLEKLTAPYRKDPKLKAYRLLTPANAEGLFRAMMETPDAVLVLENCDRLVKSQHGKSLLRTIFKISKKDECLVTWCTARLNGRVEFTGGVILLLP